MDMAWQLIFLFYHLNNYWVWRHGAGSKRYRRRSSYRIDILILIIWDRYDLYEFQFSSSTSDQQRQKHGETVGYHQRWSIWRWLLKIHTGCPWLDIEEMTSSNARCIFFFIYIYYQVVVQCLSEGFIECNSCTKLYFNFHKNTQLTKMSNIFGVRIYYSLSLLKFLTFNSAQYNLYDFIPIHVLSK